MAKIVIAPDAFKGTLTAAAAAAAMADGCRRAACQDYRLLPLADGGEGTLAVLEQQLDAVEWHHGRHGEWLSCHLDGCRTAIIESANVIGFCLPVMRSQDVLSRSSAALGEQLLEALDSGAQQLIVALGGTATVDAGLGLLQALGAVVRDRRSGQVLANDLAALLSAEAIDIDLSLLDPRLQARPLTVLVDVDAPLLGLTGAALCYGRQKGLAEDLLLSADGALRRFADVWEAAGHDCCRHRAGAGAAGGLGFALAMLGGELVMGADWMMARLALAENLEKGGWLLTGEGHSDHQTLAGKLPWQAAAMARQHGARAILISGVIDVAVRQALSMRFWSLIEAPGKEDAAEKLARAVHRVLRIETASGRGC